MRLLFLPTFSAKGASKTTDYSNGRYASISQDGIVCFWSMSLKLLASHKVVAPPPRTKDIWITDGAYVPSAGYIAMSTTARDIIFYEVGANGARFNRLTRINGLDTCISRMTYHDGGYYGRSLLLFGDCRGGVGAVSFDRGPHLTVLNGKGTKKTKRDSIPFAEILAGDIQTMRGKTFLEAMDPRRPLRG